MTLRAHLEAIATAPQRGSDPMANLADSIDRDRPLHDALGTLAGTRAAWRLSDDIVDPATAPSALLPPLP